MIKWFWRKMCKTGSILLSLFTSVFSALLVNYGINFIRNASKMDKGEIFVNIMIIISSGMMIWHIIGLNINLLQSERLLEKIKYISDIVSEEWIFNHSYTDKIKNRIIALLICVCALFLLFLSSFIFAII